MTSFVCGTCGQYHDGLPTAFRLDFPEESYVGGVRFSRDGELCEGGDDRFILANIELPRVGADSENFVWTCWISLSKA